MDAFCSAISISNIYPALKIRLYISFLFGFFQMLMTCLGFYLGSFFPLFSNYKNIISLIILTYIGISMIIESFSNKEIHSFHFFKSIGIAVATSIDAFCVGFSFSFYLDSPFTSSFIIGIITLFNSFIGTCIGKITRQYFDKYSSILGGVLLILLGIHAFFI